MTVVSIVTIAIHAVTTDYSDKQRNEFVIMLIRGDAAVVGPVLAKAKEVLGVPRDFGRKAPLVAQPHVPINVIFARLVRTGGRIDFLMFVEQAEAGIAIVAALRPGDFANAAGPDGLMGLPIGIVRRSIRADWKDA